MIYFWTQLQTSATVKLLRSLFNQRLSKDHVRYVFTVLLSEYQELKSSIRSVIIQTLRPVSGAQFLTFFMRLVNHLFFNESSNYKCYILVVFAPNRTIHLITLRFIIHWLDNTNIVKTALTQYRNTPFGIPEMVLSVHGLHPYVPSRGRSGCQSSHRLFHDYSWISIGTRESTAMPILF